MHVSETFSLGESTYAFRWGESLAKGNLPTPFLSEHFDLSKSTYVLHCFLIRKGHVYRTRGKLEALTKRQNRGDPVTQSLRSHREIAGIPNEVDDAWLPLSLSISTQRCDRAFRLQRRTATHFDIERGLLRTRCGVFP